jgi:hypothetical protein
MLPTPNLADCVSLVPIRWSSFTRKYILITLNTYKKRFNTLMKNPGSPKKSPKKHYIVVKKSKTICWKKCTFHSFRRSFVPLLRRSVVPSFHCTIFLFNHCSIVYHRSHRHGHHHHYHQGKNLKIKTKTFQNVSPSPILYFMGV